MKYLIYFFIVASIYGQDSLNIDLSFLDNKDKLKIDSSFETYDVIPKGTMLELNSKRIWTNYSTNNFNNNIKPTLPLQFKKQKESFIDSDLFLVVVSSAVLFGATSAYFKLESDIAHEKYLKTDDKSYLDKTDRYDVYSGIALGALQVNFGYLIYKFLSD